jgi:hypothetical protein
MVYALHYGAELLSGHAFLLLAKLLRQFISCSFFLLWQTTDTYTLFRHKAASMAQKMRYFAFTFQII